MIVKHRFRIPTDPRGKIKSGMKSPKGLPQALDYFNIGKFPELIEAYGEKPTAMVVMFPSDRITDFYDSNYELWKRRKKGDNAGKGMLLRSCDGATCIHRTDETLESKDEKVLAKFKAGESSTCSCEAFRDSISDRSKCTYVCRFSAWVALPQTGKVENPLCYRFEAGFNSGENVLSGLELAKMLTPSGRLVGIPFHLSVTMIESKKEIGKRFPVWSLRPVGLVSDMEKTLPKFSGSGSPPMMLTEGASATVVDDRAVSKAVELYRNKIALTIDRTTLGQLYRSIKADERLTSAEWDDLESLMKKKASTFPVEKS